MNKEIVGVFGDRGHWSVPDSESLTRNVYVVVGLVVLALIVVVCYIRSAREGTVPKVI